MEWIGLVDCNNFFVSCERLFRPDLKNVPVVVLSSNDGCVVARSQEIKDMGVPMGVPYFKIKDIIKDKGVVTFSSHFTLYRDLSHRVFEVVRNHFDTVEQYSIDESFFVVKGSESEVLEIAKALKDNIEKKIGLPVSVGIAPSKTIAKYANKVAKKTNGLKVLTYESWYEMTKDIKLSEIWGVGPQLTKTFTKHGLSQVREFTELPLDVVKNLFGVVGIRLSAELKGEIVNPVSKRREPQQSIMSSRSFSEVSDNIEVISDAIAFHTRQIAEDLRGMKMKAKYLKVSIQPSRYSDFALQGSIEEVYLPMPTNDVFVLLKAANELLLQTFREGVPYKKAGVIVSQLVPEIVNQPSFFEEVKLPDTESLLNAIDALNRRAGKELVSVGNRFLGESWKTKTTLISPAYTTKWTDVAKVKA